MDIADIADLLLFEAPDFRNIPTGAERSVILHWDTFGPHGVQDRTLPGSEQERWVFINDTRTLDEFGFELCIRQYTRSSTCGYGGSRNDAGLVPNAMEVLEQAAASMNGEPA
jgi:hypothetical protein